MSKVELLHSFGNDLMVANVARVSYGKEAEEFGDKEEGLINFLARNLHTSPFRHPQLQFRVQCPIYVERQLFKHQVGWTANSISGRYVDFSDTYHKITTWRYQSKSSKQGSAGDLDILSNIEANKIQDEVIAFCSNAYSRLTNLGVSKEQARSVLPLCLETTYIWTGSLFAFTHLCNLRLKPDAQQETRDVVQHMLDLVHQLEGEPFKHSLAAFGH